MNPSVPRVAVVIPALDEAVTIAAVIERLIAFAVNCADCAITVMVVDNGSTDMTATIAADAGAVVIDEPRRGYGYACAAGAREALATGADIIVWIDGDGSSRPEELGVLLAPLLTDAADLVLGSRELGPIEPGAMPPHQRWGNRASSRLMALLYGIELTDLGPFRAISAALFETLDMSEMTFGWPTEMTVKSANARARIVEVPTAWDRRGGGRSKVSGTVKGSVLAARHIVGTTLRYSPLRRSIANPLRR